MHGRSFPEVIGVVLPPCVKRRKSRRLLYQGVKPLSLQVPFNELLRYSPDWALSIMIYWPKRGFIGRFECFVSFRLFVALIARSPEASSLLWLLQKRTPQVFIKACGVLFLIASGGII
jgi:hypothetical protein